MAVVFDQIGDFSPSGEPLASSNSQSAADALAQERSRLGVRRVQQLFLRGLPTQNHGKRSHVGAFAFIHPKNIQTLRSIALNASFLEKFKILESQK